MYQTGIWKEEHLKYLTPWNELKRIVIPFYITDLNDEDKNL
jgi:hypothetical protein